MFTEGPIELGGGGGIARTACIVGGGENSNPAAAARKWRWKRIIFCDNSEAKRGLLSARMARCRLFHFHYCYYGWMVGLSLLPFLYIGRCRVVRIKYLLRWGGRLWRLGPRKCPYWLRNVCMYGEPCYVCVYVCMTVAVCVWDSRRLGCVYDFTEWESLMGLFFPFSLVYILGTCTLFVDTYLHIL